MTTIKRLSLAAVLVLAMATGSQALEPTVVTFDNGTEGWSANPDCETLPDTGGNPDHFLNFINTTCDGSIFFPRAFFRVTTDTNPAFIGDYTARGPVQISVDVNVTAYDFFSFWGPPVAVEEYRQLVVEFIDHDDPYTDPDTGYSWPWTSVIYPAGYFQSRDAGWKTFEINIEDPNATEVPEGWTGFGGPEDPNTYMPQLPPDRTFADVMAGVDEIQIHSIEPGYFYAIAFLHDLNFDNIAIRELPRTCAGLDATIWVDNDGMIHGGAQDGMLYDGYLEGTWANDVMVGTAGDDVITGHRGNDIICGWGGDDEINGQHDADMLFGQGGNDTLIGQGGDDFIDGGDGRDVINGGQGIDTCLGGEVVNQCSAGSRTGRGVIDRGGHRRGRENTESRPTNGIVHLDRR